MTKVRYVVPGGIYLLTRRVHERRFLLRPDSLINAVFEYLLAVAAARYGIQLIAVVVMSNHYHLVFYDPRGCHPKFTQYLNGLIARVTNRHRQRSDTFWSGDEPNVPELVDNAIVLEKIGYTLTNPSKDGMVRRSRDWPGVRSTPQAYCQAAKVVRRPSFFFRADGDMPETAELRFVVPPSHGHLSPEAFGQLVADEVARGDAAAREKLAREGRSFLGVRGIRRTRWSDRAKTPEARGPHGARRPRVLARCRKARRGALERLKTFYAAYAVARERFAAGSHDVIFPAGTWKMRVEFGVRCHDPP